MWRKEAGRDGRGDDPVKGRKMDHTEMMDRQRIPGCQHEDRRPIAECTTTKNFPPDQSDAAVLPNKSQEGAYYPQTDGAHPEQFEDHMSSTSATSSSTVDGDGTTLKQIVGGRNHGDSAHDPLLSSGDMDSGAVVPDQLQTVPAHFAWMFLATLIGVGCLFVVSAEDASMTSSKSGKTVSHRPFLSAQWWDFTGYHAGRSEVE